MLRQIIPKAITLILLIVFIGAKWNIRVEATSSIFVVPNSGYETIQEAINAANPGDIINVTAGLYNERITVNKSLTIIGENPATTIIDGGGGGNVVTITSPNVVISRFTIQNGKQGDWPYSGISIFRCDSAVVNNNVLRDNYYGLQLIQSNNSKIFNNLIINNSYAGIKISDSSNNIFFENIIQNNSVGLWGSKSPLNVVYHNNFLNNTSQLQIFDSPMIWDDGSEGNYWSDYKGSDADMDGIGDSEYLKAGDQFPLTGMFTNFTIFYESQKYFLSTICNSTILNFQFDELHKRISFDVSGPNSTAGFCRIAIPETLVQKLWQSNYTILVEGNVPVNILNWTSSVYSYSYFIYHHAETSQEVTIIPELSEIMVLPLLILTSLIATILTRINKRKNEINYT